MYYDNEMYFGEKKENAIWLSLSNVSGIKGERSDTRYLRSGCVFIYYDESRTTGIPCSSHETGTPHNKANSMTIMCADRIVTFSMTRRLCCAYTGTVLIICYHGQRTLTRDAQSFLDAISIASFMMWRPYSLRRRWSRRQFRS